MDLLLLVSNLIQRLSSTREDLKAGSFIQAAEALRDLKAAVPPPDPNETDSPAIFSLLRAEWMECFDEVQEVLARIVENAVIFEPENRALRVKYRLRVNELEGVELHKIFAAMDIVGALNYGLAKIADLMIKHVFIPTVRDGSVTIFVGKLNQESQQKDGAMLSLVSSSDLRVECLNGATIFSRLIQVTKFIYESIFFCNGTWMSYFGRLTWSRISELVITDFLSKVVPDDASKLAEFQANVKLSTEFENALKEMMFISATDKKDDKLSTYAENVEVHFASRKKNEILAKARNLLLQCEFVLPPEKLRPVVAESSYECAVDLLFQPERCHVSEAALKLMELVHQILKCRMCAFHPQELPWNSIMLQGMHFFYMKLLYL